MKKKSAFSLNLWIFLIVLVLLISSLLVESEILVQSLLNGLIVATAILILTLLLVGRLVKDKNAKDPRSVLLLVIGATAMYQSGLVVFQTAPLVDLGAMLFAMLFLLVPSTFAIGLSVASFLVPNMFK